MSKSDNDSAVSSGPVACEFLDNFFESLAWDPSATTKYAAFSRAIIRYVFGLNPEVIGEIDRIVWSIDRDVELAGNFVHGRMARVYTTKDKKNLYFYVFAGSLPFPPKKWEIIARSDLLNGVARKPEESEMLWLEK